MVFLAEVYIVIRPCPFKSWTGVTQRLRFKGFHGNGPGTPHLKYVGSVNRILIGTNRHCAEILIFQELGSGNPRVFVCFVLFLGKDVGHIHLFFFKV